MLVYHFLRETDALDDIRRKRIKLSEIDKLNDPFELWCSSAGDYRARRDLRVWKKEVAKQFGILCFSRSWQNTVLWSHYAANHRGICLGFEVDDQYLRPITYVKERLPLSVPITEAAIQQLLYTKYKDWSYEEELRGWFRFDERDPSGHYFYDFDEKIRLSKVIAGPLCSTTKMEIESALKSYENGIHVIKARLAFTSFQVVEDRRGFGRSAHSATSAH